jgi:hypothetical protein
VRHNPFEHHALGGTEEWALARAGVITASCFDKLLTAAKLEPSKSARPYLCGLAGEIVLGSPAETYQSGMMARGLEMEEEARVYYETILLDSDDEVRPSGLWYLNDDRRVGASPDAIVGEHGGLELKCPGLAKHVEYLIGGGCPQEYVHQVQGCLYVTARKWWDFVSYYPGLPALHVRCLPDPRWTSALDKALPEAITLLDELLGQLKAAA